MSGEVMRIVRRMVEPLQRRVRLMVARAVVDLVNDETKAQALQVKLLADEVRADVERFTEYGFASLPSPNSEAVWLSVGGNRNHGIVVCVMDREKRPVGAMAEGDVALFDGDGFKVYLKNGSGEVHLGAQEASDFAAQSQKTDDAIQAIVDAFNAHVDAFNAHAHPTGTGTSGPPTSPANSLAAQPSVAATKVKVE